MNRFSIILGATAFFAIGMAIQAALDLEDVARFLRAYLPSIVIAIIAGLVMLGVGLWTVAVFLRRKAQRFLEVEDSLNDEELVKNVVQQLTGSNSLSFNAQNATIVTLGTWWLRREAKQFYFNVTVTVMGGLIGTTTLFLLYEQNKLVTEQNRRITLQTDANVVQSVLLESARRTANSQELNTLLVDLRSAGESILDECEGDVETGCWRIWQHEGQQQRRLSLSEQLQQRVEGFARRNTPYFTISPKTQIVEFDQRLNAQIDLPYQSPERGQLIQELVRNNVELSGVDFSYAALTAADLSGRYMANVRLEWADMSDAQLSAAFLPEAVMTDALLSEAALDNLFGLNARFSRAKMAGTILTGSYLVGATFLDAELDGAALNSTNLSGARFIGANLRDADFRNANLSGVDLSDTNLSNASFGWANVSDADFGGSLQANISMGSAWAWEDAAPRGLEIGIELKLCSYESGMERMSKPDNSNCRAVIVSTIE